MGSKGRLVTGCARRNRWKREREREEERKKNSETVTSAAGVEFKTAHKEGSLNGVTGVIDGKEKKERKTEVRAGNPLMPFIA